MIRSLQPLSKVFPISCSQLSYLTLQFLKLLRRGVPKTEEDNILLWLQHLETVLHDVDDVVDDVHIHLASERGRISNKVSFPFLRLNPFPQHPKLIQELRGILERLPRTKGEFFHPNPDSFVNLARKQYAPPDFKISAFHGRESDKNAVIDLILNSVSEAERVSVVPIVGFKGIGKTTLAQSIYNSERIQCVFHLTLCLYLAADCRDISSFQKMLIHQITEMYLGDFRDAEETVMKMKACELLREYRFLLVLDDFEDTNLHKSIARDLIDMGSAGSAIIVTTSSRRAASLIGTTPAYQLQPLSLDASFQVFAENARIHKQMHPKYETRLREIAELCGGIPLVLKMVAEFSSQDGILDRGRDLGFLQDHDFKNIIICELRFLDVMLANLPHLKLLLQSFRSLKACGLSVEALICVWMALGFLHSDDPTQPPEDIGRMYLKDFVESALFPNVEYAPGGVIRDIKFNEVLYCFASPNARQYWVVSSDKIIFDSDARYIIWDVDYLQGRNGVAFLNQNIRHPNKVRLFMVGTRGQVSEAFVEGIVSKLGRLRVLGLAGCNLVMLPQNIGLSTHLRYLDVGSNARIKRLPDSICNLWHLQTLLLHGCHQLEEVPANIGRLQNLRCLTLTILKESLPEEIGQLTSLRSLGLASCQRLASLPRSIKNLKNLQTFGIFYCHELDLADSSSVEGLKGLYAIQTLLLSDLAKFASLPSDSGSLSIVLKHLLIQSCRSLKETAWITRFRSLRSLTIEDCPDLSALTLIDGTSQFDSLVELVIRSCPSLGYTAWIRLFIFLRSLIIDDCPKLVDLDAGFSDLKNLERLEIRRCPHLTEWFASPAGKDWCHIAHVPVIELDGVRLKS